jgi:hypothetical protein
MPLQTRVRPSIPSLQPQQLQIHISAARPRFIDRRALVRPGSQRRVRLFQQPLIFSANRRFEPRCNTRQFRPHKCAPHASVKSTLAAIHLTPLFPETCLIPARTHPQVPVPTKSPPPALSAHSKEPRSPHQGLSPFALSTHRHFDRSKPTPFLPPRSCLPRASSGARWSACVGRLPGIPRCSRDEISLRLLLALSFHSA